MQYNNCIATNFPLQHEVASAIVACTFLGLNNKCSIAFSKTTDG